MILLLLACAKPAAPTRPPDVLVIILDTVRADSLDAYGGAARTPNFDLVAQRGARFADVTAPAPWTWPSHASLFTGLYPWEHGAHRVAEGGIEMGPLRFAPLRPDVPTLASDFAAAGYRTVLHSANVLVGPQFPSLARGFEKVAYAEKDEDVVRATVDVLAQEPERPLFAVVNLFGAHAPYTRHGGSEADVPAWVEPWTSGDSIELQRRGKDGEPTLMTAFLDGAVSTPPDGLAYLRSIYDGEVQALDLYVGVLATKLYERSPDAIVAVLADHGEGFGEHGILGHGVGLGPEVLHVPLAILAPGRIAAGTIVSAPIGLRDLFQGIESLAGIQPRGGALVGALDGRPTGHVRAMAEPDAYVARVTGHREFGESWMLYRDGRWAAIAHATATALYDVATDPRMEHPLADVPAEAAAVVAAAQQVPAEAGPTAAPDAPDADAIARLKALGYVP